MKDYNNSIAVTSNYHWKKIIIPLVIILIGIFVSGVIFYTSWKKTNNNILNNSYSSINVKGVTNFTPGSPENVLPVTEKDHILGNPNAPVKLIEFSDLECPFCKVFHKTMQKIMEEYGKSGEVAWIYRHLSIDQIHSKSRIEATAAECASEIGRQNTFWNYIGNVFEITPSNNGLDLSLLPQIAQDIGVDGVKFKECLTSGRYDEHIENNLQDGINSGANGTPYIIIIAPNGKKFPILGSQTYSTIALTIDLALKEK